MNEKAPLHTWLINPMEPQVRSTIERVRRAEDVAHIAIMPDVHLANDVCVGTVIATRRLVYPAAVGGDIGCGMLAIPFNSDADILYNPAHAGLLLRKLREQVLISRRHRNRAIPLPSHVNAADLSHLALTSVLKDVGSLQVGTLGGGNHFVEFQSDSDNRLWLMVHSGSRAMGQVIKAHHISKSTQKSASMMLLDTALDEGQAYLNDQQWARRYAHANRLALAERTIFAMKEIFSVEPIESLAIYCDHNHVQFETHLGRPMLIHRKGAMPADTNTPGIIPGSMGTASYHVTGKGCELSLKSSSHGAGRQLSRHASREKFDRKDLQRQMQGVWFDPALTHHLIEELPKSYKNIIAVMRAQTDLVKIERMLKPILVYKGG